MSAATASDRNDKMRFIGHRGASAVAPENTLKAVRLALTRGAGFEIDLQMLKDGTVIVLHDDTLYRTAAVSWLQGMFSDVLKQPVGNLNLTQATSVAVGDSSHSEAVPTFSDALRELLHPPPCPDPRRVVHCFAELKAHGHSSSSGFDPRLTEASAAAVAAAALAPSQLTWISFSLGALLDMKRRLPQHPALLVAYAGSSEQAWAIARLAVQSDLDGIDLNADPSVVTKELVEWLHARGKRVAVWVWRAPGANDVEAVWEHMAACGVDDFTSNLPSGLEQWRDRA